MDLFHIKNPFALIIFGASGDLAKLKLFPAIYKLAEQKRLPRSFYIIGYARSKKDQKVFREEFTEAIKKAYKKPDKKILSQLEKHLYYFQGQYDQLQDFVALRQYLKTLTRSRTITKLAYFSVPPVVFRPIIQNLGDSRILPNEDLRLIIEKPFGQDTETAQDLFHFTARYFNEESIYLLDHYLGKSAVQSLLHLRHSNYLLNLMMKGPTVANIQITASEKLGVEDRAGYFEQVGTIKDMIQSHLLQVLALIAMSIPITESPGSLHREKSTLLSALRFIESKKNLALGQYDGYKKGKGIPSNSKTETFAAIRLFIDRESWYKTPIYIRTGKKLNEKHTYVVVELKKFAFQGREEEPNRLIFELQPEERISIRLVNKIGSNTVHQDITTGADIGCNDDCCLPEHAELLLDVIQKNRLHFLSFQEIISTWKIVDKITNFINKKGLKPEKYEPGSTGPKSQHGLTKMDGFQWFDPH